MEQLMKGYEKSHNTYKSIVIISVSLMFLAIIAALFYSYTLNQMIANSSWVSINGQVYKAELKGHYNYPERKYEIQQAAKEYYLNRYSGDRYTIKQNIKSAIELCGYCGKDILLEYTDEAMEKNIIEKGFIYSAIVDSVRLQNNGYNGYLFGRQLIKTRSRELYRNVYIKFEGKAVNRAEQNPIGVIFDKIEVINNQIISNNIIN